MSQASLVPVKLENLFIDLCNARYEPRSSQRDALAKISHDQGLKLYNLAEDIVAKGINPAELLIVTPADGPGVYIVLEGNRRVAALKLLSSPTLVASLNLQPGLLKKYTALIERAKGSLPTELQCVVLSREDAKDWIKLKHTGENEGIGIVSWDGRARHRFRGSSPALQAIELVEASDLLDNDTKANLPKIAITNIERILGTPDARILLGVDVKNDKLSLNPPDDVAMGRLALIVSDVANRIIRVTDLDTKELRVAYAGDIASRPLPKSATSTAGRSSSARPQPTSATRIAPNRTILIPKNLKLRIPQTRINRIFDELQRLNAELYLNACAVLLRVFVELSVDDYAQRHRVSLKVIPKRQKGTRAAPQLKDMTLRQKLRTVADNLEARNVCTKHELQGVRTLTSTRNHVLSVDTLNAYVHNKDYNPTATDLKLNWDNIQVFIERLWAN
jgi:hypothetical protein